NKKIIFAHLATMFMLAGHYTVYAYFTPFLETTLDLEASWISVFYFLFGIAAVAGGVIGGGLATRIGYKNSILIILVSFLLCFFILPYSTIAMQFLNNAIIIWYGVT